MAKPDPEIEKNTALKLIRQAISSHNLRQLRDGLDQAWPRRVLRETTADADPTGLYIIFKEALKDMPKEDRRRAFQWTWDCYHHYMSDLGKCLEDLDGYTMGRRS